MPEPNDIQEPDDGDLAAHLCAQLADAAEKIVTPWEAYKAQAERLPHAVATGVVVPARHLDALQRALREASDLLTAIPDGATPDPRD